MQSAGIRRSRLGHQQQLVLVHQHLTAVSSATDQQLHLLHVSVAASQQACAHARAVAGMVLASRSVLHLKLEVKLPEQ
jgi:hypothetical protein